MKILRKIENQVTDRDRPRAGTLNSLSQTLGERTLVKLALDAVQTVDWENVEEELKARCECQPRMMLTLLSFCYASGIYGSQQIRQAMRDHAMVRYICAKEFPDESALRKFRKENRALLTQCLTYMFQQAWALKFDQAEEDFLGYDWFESVLNAQIQSETARRIDLAIFMDVMQWDRDY